MSWVRVDDAFWQHPKFLGLSEDALALWIRALAYTNASKTNGVVPVAALTLLSRTKKPARAAQELVDARLWEVHEKGWLFHDWTEYQATREAREQATKDKSRRQQEWREKHQRGASTSQTETAGSAHVDASTPTPRDAAPTPIPSHPLPVPSHPIEEEKREGDGEGAAAPAPANVKSKGSRAPSSVDPEASAWLEREGIPSLSSESGTAVAEFLDYWTAIGGAAGCKVNWAATWRNNEKRAARFGGARSAPVQRSLGYQATEERKRAAFNAEAKAIQDKQRAELGLGPDDMVF